MDVFFKIYKEKFSLVLYYYGSEISYTQFYT